MTLTWWSASQRPSVAVWLMKMKPSVRVKMLTTLHRGFRISGLGQLIEAVLRRPTGRIRRLNGVLING